MRAPRHGRFAESLADLNSNMIQTCVCLHSDHFFCKANELKMTISNALISRIRYGFFVNETSDKNHSRMEIVSINRTQFQSHVRRYQASLRSGGGGA